MLRAGDRTALARCADRRQPRVMRLHYCVLALPLVALTASVQARAPRAPGFADLFNGKDLSRWEGDPAFWSVQNGAITGRTTAAHPAPGNTFWCGKEAWSRTSSCVSSSGSWRTTLGGGPT